MTIADWTYLVFDLTTDGNILVTSDIGGRNGSIRFQVRISYIIPVMLDRLVCRDSMNWVNGCYHSMPEFTFLSAGDSSNKCLFFYT